MPRTTETIPAGALTPMLTRIANGKAAFVSDLQSVSGLDRADAEKVAAYYLKHKLAKVDAGIGRVNVKHGAYWDRDVILRAFEVATGAV